MEKIIRVMIASMEPVGEEGGARTLARCLRDEGFEVIFACCRQSPEQVVSAAIQEDIDVLGLSSISGRDLHLFSGVSKRLIERGAADITVIAQGAIPQEDFKVLYAAGVRKIFSPGDPEEIAGWIRENVGV
ncbi:MAG: cobalamin-dependent protein [Syntrophales bacterium]